MAASQIMEAFERLGPAIGQCMLRDQGPLRRRLKSVRAAQAAGRADPDALGALEQQIQGSIDTARRRSEACPRVEFPQSLPIDAHTKDIASALASRQVIVVCGETGSGKSTQLPKLCLSLGRGIRGMIGHTQPRRIAARTIASRIAQELGVEVGQAVGFKVRFRDRAGPATYIKLMTDGILLAEIESDRRLEAYDTLIIDEAHERTLNIDFLLGYLKDLLPKRPDLKVVLTSATIDPERFARHFNDAPIIEVSGRVYPVELRYRPLQADEEGAEDRDLGQAIVAAVDELSREPPGDILIFLPGEREIRETAESLRHLRMTEILALYSRLSAAEQDRVFTGHPGRRIVLATNVAETSVTVPGIRYVIDTGLARINRFNANTKVQRLLTERISQASAQQRKGRCGRLSAGICIRLYAREDYEARPEYTDPEILRSNMAAVILKLRALGMEELERFPLLDAPDSRAIKAGYKLLEELSATDAAKRLTALGRQLARFPVDPRIGRIILSAREYHCLAELLIIAAALSIQDPRERPFDVREEADEAQRIFADPRSDFLWFLRFWQFYSEQARHLSKNKLRTVCKTHFVSPVRMQEWIEVEGQLRALANDLGLVMNAAPADYDAVHKALLTGFLDQVGFKYEKNQYLGVRGAKFHVFPGSALFKKSGAWIVAAEIVHTSRLYARTAATVEPEWIEHAARHLVRRSYSEPHWERKTGRVSAYERVTLYGLILIANRKVDYTAIDPVESRRLFIQSALVEAQYETAAPFFTHNRQLVADIEELQSRARRLDLLADEQVRYDFFDQRIPPDVNSVASFEHWRAKMERDNPSYLYFNTDMLMRNGLETEESFPSRLVIDGTELALSYRFEPGHDADGVSVTLPVIVLNQVQESFFDWLVPGWLPEKIAALIRLLPKALRKDFIPIEHYANACARALRPNSGSLIDSLAAELKRLTGVLIPHDAWDLSRLPEHLRMNFRVVDGDGRVLGESRRLGPLQRQLGDRARTAFCVNWTLERERITRWDFGQLPRQVQTSQGGVSLRGFPALVDCQDAVAIRVFDSEEHAEREHRAGLRRLFALELPQQIKYLKKTTPRIEKAVLLHRPLGNRDALLLDLIDATIDRAFLSLPAEIRAEGEFRKRLAQGSGELIPTFDGLVDLMLAVLVEWQAVQKRLAGAHPSAERDVREQLSYLVHPGFVSATPADWLPELPRFLRAAGLRLARFQRDPLKDSQRAASIATCWNRCLERLRAQDSAPEFIRYRWLVEEYRVSLFAQDLGTSAPVSQARLDAQWNRVQTSLPAAGRVA
ncbi:MAG: ATP-dependent RNA helicase HrpA [Chromatiales bacterium]